MKKMHNMFIFSLKSYSLWLRTFAVYVVGENLGVRDRYQNKEPVQGRVNSAPVLVTPFQNTLKIISSGAHYQCDPAKIFFTSKFSYVAYSFATPPIKLKLEQ